jgi:hypothetical protein
MITKLLILLLTTGVLSVIPLQQPQPQKKLKFEFTVAETELIYNALGKLPAEQVEVVRSYIIIEYRKQIVDTIKKKN